MLTKNRIKTLEKKVGKNRIDRNELLDKLKDICYWELELFINEHSDLFWRSTDGKLFWDAVKEVSGGDIKNWSKNLPLKITPEQERKRGLREIFHGEKYKGM